MPRVHLGDKGTTQVNLSTERINKGSSLINFYAQIDVLNAQLNICINVANKKNKSSALKIQVDDILKNLIKINSSIAATFFCLQNKINQQLLKKILNTAKQLEDNFNVNDFVWIYSNELASHINLARTYARITENAYYKIKNNPLIKHSIDDSQIKVFLNRQSTILFHLAIGLENYID